MRLIGMLDSPYVRRVAVSLDMLGIPFTHEPLSVFRHFDAFAAVNPVVKAPTLMTDEGVVLMDSTLILEVAERLARDRATLEPAGTDAFIRAQHVIGLALAACEKAVQIVYEHKLRPDEKRHQPWVERVTGQLRHACRLLDATVAPAQPWLFGPAPLQADITAAVAWRFIQANVADLVPDADHPHLARLSATAERHPAFRVFSPV